jgi:hypothetical protein
MIAPITSLPAGLWCQSYIPIVTIEAVGILSGIGIVAATVHPPVPAPPIGELVDGSADSAATV